MTYDALPVSYYFQLKRIAKFLSTFNIFKISFSLFILRLICCAHLKLHKPKNEYIRISTNMLY